MKELKLICINQRCYSQITEFQFSPLFNITSKNQGLMITIKVILQVEKVFLLQFHPSCWGISRVYKNNSEYI